MNNLTIKEVLADALKFWSSYYNDKPQDSNDDFLRSLMRGLERFDKEDIQNACDKWHLNHTNFPTVQQFVVHCNKWAKNKPASNLQDLRNDSEYLSIKNYNDAVHEKLLRRIADNKIEYRSLLDLHTVMSNNELNARSNSRNWKKFDTETLIHVNNC